MLKTMTSMILVTAFFAVTYHVSGAIGSGDFMGFQYRGMEVDVTVFFAIAGMTLTGAFMGCLYEYFSKYDDETTPWWTILYKGIRSKTFGLSLIVTPLIVFYVFDQLYASKPDAGIALFCLQSGFFWNRTLKLISNNVLTTKQAKFTPKTQDVI